MLPPNLPPRSGPRTSSQPIRTIQRWSSRLWSIRLDRPDGFRFEAGHYLRLGLGPEPRLWRPYSIVSSPAEPWLEFLITLIPDGAWTRQLAQLEVGALIEVELLPLGFFLETALSPGSNLWLLATGSGLGPYVSLLRQAAVFERYRQIRLVHSVRLRAELSYADELRALAQQQPGFRYLPLVTRETCPESGPRIPELLTSGALETRLDLRLDAAESRVMVCGNPEFSQQLRQQLSARAFIPCRRGLNGSMLFEQYW